LGNLAPERLTAEHFVVDAAVLEVLGPVFLRIFDWVVEGWLHEFVEDAEADVVVGALLFLCELS